MSEPEFEMFKQDVDEAYSHLLRMEQIIEKEDKIRNEQKTYNGEAVWIVDKKTGKRDIMLTKLGEEKLEQRWDEYDEQSRNE